MIIGKELAWRLAYCANPATRFNEAIDDINDILVALTSWQEELEDIHDAFGPWGDLFDIIVDLGVDLDALPPMPVAPPPGPPEPPNPNSPPFVSDPNAFWVAASQWHTTVGLWMSGANTWRNGAFNWWTEIDLLEFPSGANPDWVIIMELFDQLDELPFIPPNPIPCEFEPFPYVPPLPRFRPRKLPEPPQLFPEPEYDLVFGDDVGEVPELGENVRVPEAEYAIDGFEGTRPYRPELDEPPEPDDFWAALDDMHGQLFTFDPYEFLTDEIRAAVDSQLVNFDNYLDFARLDLASQFAENVAMLLDVRFGYIQYLSDLRAAAIDAESAEMDNLRERVEAFHEVATLRSDDTRDRLTDFSEMLPLSRTYVGVNREMVDFAAQPIEFIQPVLRGEMVTDITEVAGFPMWWLWLAIGAFGATVIGVAVYSIIEAMRREGKRVAKRKA